MSIAIIPSKHEDVRFHFLGADEDSELTGTVLIRVSIIFVGKSVTLQ
jgi:hypothetical protein